MIDKWSMIEICCDSCMYYVPKAGNMGRCRRNAPTMSGYPVVHAYHDWCGEHKLGTNPHKEGHKTVAAPDS